MAKKKIELSNVTASETIKVNDQAVYTLSADDAKVSVASATGVGTFDWTGNKASDAKFIADAALSGEVELAITAGATLKSADFSKTTSGITYAGTTGVASIAGGAGNDVVKVTDTTNATEVTLGAGADTLDVAAGAKADIVDYNYYEGDVIKFASAPNKVDLKSDGSLDIDSNITANAGKIAVKDSWYAARVNNGTANVDYFTAVGGNNQNVTKDLSDSAIANVINATGAKTANITLGKGNDTVSLATAGTGADTIKVGKASGENIINNFGTEDVVAIDGIKLVTLGLGKTGSTSVKASYGSTALTFDASVNTIKGSLNINDGSQTHKLAYDLAGNSKLDYKTYSDADWVLGTAGASGTTLEVGATTHLHDMSKYRDITNISVSTDAKLDAPISLTGAIDKANKIDAANAKVGVAAWGFSSGSDTIALSATNKAQDTVWFGAGDGNDTISGFAYGTASDSDVLYLKDTKTLKDIDVAFDSTGGDKAKFTVGKAVADVNKNGVASSSDVAQIKLADEKTYKVAGEYTAANGVTINTDDIDGLDYYAFAGDGNAKAVSITGSKDWIFHSLYTDFYTTGANVATVDASKATGNVTLAAAASIKGGAGTNNIWTYQANTSATVTAGTGTDIIWFAENADQAVSVSGFTAGTDVVKFATAQSLKEIADNYSFATAGTGNTDTTINGVNNTASVLTLTGVSDSTINLVDGSDKAYKALVNKTAKGTFATDVNIYAGMTELTVDGSVEGTVSVRVGKESRGLSSDTYFIDNSVTTFDASQSTATFWVAGNANAATTIKGGLTENYLYGGGAASDELFGSVAAKDTFYFGTGDGTDKISGGVDKEDTIALWNVADADIANVSVSINKSNQVEISLSDSSKLTITDANGATALTDGLTFTSASQTAYTYDSKSKTLVKKA